MRSLSRLEKLRRKIAIDYINVVKLPFSKRGRYTCNKIGCEKAGDYRSRIQMGWQGVEQYECYEHLNELQKYLLELGIKDTRKAMAKKPKEEKEQGTLF